MADEKKEQKSPAAEKKDKDKDLFRKVALERLSSPEQLDRLMQITTPRGWIALSVSGVLLTLLVVWSVVGQLEQSVDGQGRLEAAPDAEIVPPFAVTAEAAGTVIDLPVLLGDEVTEGQVVAQLLPGDDGAPIQVTSPVEGRILEVNALLGDELTAGDSLLLIEIPQQVALMGVVYLPFIDAQRVQAGMEVEISPVTVPQQEFGFIIGEVLSVGDLPATDDVARAFAPDDEAVIRVEVKLNTDDTPTGYEWSFSDGPDVDLRLNTPVLASVVVEEERPISRVFPIFD